MISFILAYTLGNAPFCVVNNFSKECIYYSVSECMKEAEKQGGMCVSNTRN